MKTQIEQLAEIDKIMGGEVKNYCIKGRTFKIKEDLKSWGWFWDSQNQYWVLEGVENNDPALTSFVELEGTWIEELDLN